MPAPAPIDCRHNHYPVCPYCGHDHPDAWELDSDSGEMNCGVCNRAFSYSREIEVTYSTSPVMGPHRQDAMDQAEEAEHERHMAEKAQSWRAACR